MAGNSPDVRVQSLPASYSERESLVKVGASMYGNESSPWLIPPSPVYRVREAGIESARAAA
jgi:hypothetical protein